MTVTKTFIKVLNLDTGLSYHPILKNSIFNFSTIVSCGKVLLLTFLSPSRVLSFCFDFFFSPHESTYCILLAKCSINRLSLVSGKQLDECCSVLECLISFGCHRSRCYGSVVCLLTDLPPWLGETLHSFSAWGDKHTAVSRDSSVDNVCIMWHRYTPTLHNRTNSTLHSQFLQVLPVVVHQHVADATADVVFSLSDLLQHQQPLGLLSPLLLADPLLHTLLLLHRQIRHTNVAEINTKQTKTQISKLRNWY